MKRTTWVQDVLNHQHPRRVTVNKLSDNTTDRLRIFVAGPYCPYGATPHDAIRLAQANVDRAIEAANAIHDRGHYAFVPHLTHYLHSHYSCAKDRGDWYYDYDNTFLDLWATGLLLLKESPGANNELLRAKEHGIRIFYNLNDIPVLDGGGG